jgi:Uma2 family endonuclease
VAKVIAGKTLFTYSDYVHFPDDGRRHEIMEGEHYMTPSPVPRHQLISGRLHFQLFEQIVVPQLGVVLVAPMDVVLSDVDVVQPDLVVVLSKNRRIITPKHIRGVPDLVIEITSPSTVSRDRELKLSLYQKHRVPEYWVVLADEDTVEKFTLDGDAYAGRGSHRDRIAYDGIAGVSVDLGKVW